MPDVEPIPDSGRRFDRTLRRSWTCWLVLAIAAAVPVASQSPAAEDRRVDELQSTP